LNQITQIFAYYQVQKQRPICILTLSKNVYEFEA